MQFTMPFDWNTSRLEENKVMVHQEILIPKPSGLVTRSYMGTINGVDVTKNVVLDPDQLYKGCSSFYDTKTSCYADRSTG